MPQHKSAKKRVKTNLKSQMRNRALRATLKTKLKQVSESEDSAQALKDQQSLLDRSVKHGIVHRNKAARLKSRFAAKISK